MLNIPETSLKSASSATKVFAIPRDDQLRGMTALLDADLVRTHLGADAVEGILGCHVANVNYRPSKKCVASYVITLPNQTGGAVQQILGYGVCFEANTFAKVHKRETAKTWAKPPLGPPITALPDHQVLLFGYPNDRKLDGLRILESEDGLRQFLNSYLNGRRLREKKLTVSLIWPNYRPEKRAMLRCRIEAISEHRKPFDVTTYLKVFSDGSAARMHGALARLLTWQGTKADFTFPRPIASTQDAHVLMLSSVTGVPLRSLIGTGGAREALERTASALASLHTYEDPRSPHTTVGDHLNKARLRVQSLLQFTPELNRQAEEIYGLLQGKLPQDEQGSFGFVHGGLGLRDVLVDSQKIGFIDFDGAHTGPVAADVGRITAALRNLVLDGNLSEEDELESAFLEAYCKAARKSFAPKVIAWWTALGLIRLADQPSRQLRAKGDNKAKQLLDEAFRVLQSA